MKQTAVTAMVLGAFLEDPSSELYGTLITRAIGRKSGSISPILQRLEDLSWLKSRWEEQAFAVAKRRPPRRYYRLTGLGRREAPAYCAAVNAQLSAQLRALPGRATLGASS